MKLRVDFVSFMDAGSKQCCTVTVSSCGRSLSHACKRSRNSSGILSSQSSFKQWRSCRINFAERIKGATNPSGSYT